MSAAAAGCDDLARAGPLVRAAGLRARRPRRDRAPADRQPGHPPRADDDPRGPAARVRRPRPRLLQWAAAARHWIVLVLAAELFLPHWGGFARPPRRRSPPALPCCAPALAVVETAQAKLRILRVPALLAIGALLALVGAGLVGRGGGRVSGAVVAAHRRARPRRDRRAPALARDRAGRRAVAACSASARSTLAAERSDEFLGRQPRPAGRRPWPCPRCWSSTLRRTREPRLVAPAAPALVRLAGAAAVALAGGGARAAARARATRTPSTTAVALRAASASRSSSRAGRRCSSCSA